MNNEQILKKAIEKATNNGYKFSNISMFESSDSHYSDSWFSYDNFDYLISELIFDHDFAKAFFGRDYPWEQYEDQDEHWHHTSCCSGSGCFFDGERWQYHLQKMVLKKDPIKYLEKFI